MLRSSGRAAFALASRACRLWVGVPCLASFDPNWDSPQGSQRGRGLTEDLFNLWRSLVKTTSNRAQKRTTGSLTMPPNDDEFERIRARYHDREPLDPSYNELSGAVIGAAMKVHTSLGPGLLEAFYQRAMCLELDHARIPFRQQVPTPVSYRGTLLGQSLLDLVVDDRVVVELKSVEAIAVIHRMQLTSYLHTGDYRLGLLINFNLPRLKDGIVRLINTPYV